MYLCVCMFLPVCRCERERVYISFSFSYTHSFLLLFSDDHNSDDESCRSQELEDIAEKFGIIEEHVAEKRSFWERYQPRIWRLLDEPKSSRAAKVIGNTTECHVLSKINKGSRYFARRLVGWLVGVLGLTTH